MGLLKEGTLRRLWRGAKTLFFLLNMLISLLFLSAPVLLAVTDSLVPSLLLSASLSPSPSLSLRSLRFRLSDYDFRSSLIDVPFISIIRSAIILCVYTLCDGLRLSRGTCLGITTALCLMSLGFVSLKASHLFARPGRIDVDEIALVACSLLFAVGHVGAAYRTNCRERRKLRLYKIDIEDAMWIGYRFSVLVVGKNTDLSSSTGTQLSDESVSKRCRKTDISTLASSYPGQSRIPPPNGVKICPCIDIPELLSMIISKFD